MIGMAYGGRSKAIYQSNISPLYHEDTSKSGTDEAEAAGELAP